MVSSNNILMIINKCHVEPNVALITHSQIRYKFVEVVFIHPLGYLYFILLTCIKISLMMKIAFLYLKFECSHLFLDIQFMT